MRRRFHTLDVFTTQRFAGNPLAVVHDCDGLTTEAMQAITREFNLPETVFVLPPAEAGHRAKLRIFTPGRELPFAGHPTVGTAVLLARLDGGSGRRDLVLGEGVGPVACRVESAGEGGSARFDVPRQPERLGEAADRPKLAAALSLAADDVGFDNHGPAIWSAGNPFVFVPIKNLAAIGRAQPDLGRWGDGFPADGPVGAFLYCRQTVERGATHHARMFAPKMGIAEDPATGSAAAAFAGILATAGQLADGEHAFAIEQGLEMGRPSLIRLTLTMRAGRLATAAVGGDAVVVSEGTIEA
jgi:trans-2,3-dihydro-3-hydroxyanthranilate isomerase